MCLETFISTKSSHVADEATTNSFTRSTVFQHDTKHVGKQLKKRLKEIKRTSRSKA